MRLKTRILIALAALAGFAAFAAHAFAESPDFIGTPTCTKSTTSGLTCSGKAGGLGNGPTEAFLTASSVSATYECVNKGGAWSAGRAAERDRSQADDHAP
jgi:hypothetical protein